MLEEDRNNIFKIVSYFQQTIFKSDVIYHSQIIIQVETKYAAAKNKAEKFSIDISNCISKADDFKIRNYEFKEKLEEKLDTQLKIIKAYYFKIKSFCEQYQQRIDNLTHATRKCFELSKNQFQFERYCEVQVRINKLNILKFYVNNTLLK